MGSEPTLQPKVKTRQCGYVSEKDIQEPCREIMRRPEFQVYMVPESH